MGTANRQIQVGPGAQSFLAVAQNYNSGWKATLNGRALTPVRLDGWEQAYVVPAGSGGTVIMTFPADTWYRWRCSSEVCSWPPSAPRIGPPWPPIPAAGT